MKPKLCRFAPLFIVFSAVSMKLYPMDAAVSPAPSALKCPETVYISPSSQFTLEQIVSFRKCIAWEEDRVLLMPDMQEQYWQDVYAWPTYCSHYLGYLWDLCRYKIDGYQGTYLKAANELACVGSSVLPEEKALILERYGLFSLARAVRNISSCQKASKSVFALVEVMKRQNVPQYIAAVHGIRTLQLIKARLENQNFDLFRVLPTGLLSDFTSAHPASIALVSGRLQATKTLPQTMDFYRSFNQHFNAERRHMPVFITASRVGALNAAECGYIGVHYQNPAQLIAALRWLKLYD